MKVHRFLVFASIYCWALGASAQWQWLDKDGRKVFSDRPPSEDVPAKNILRQPGSTRLPVVPVDAQAGAAAAHAASDANAPQPQGLDKELQERKAQEDAAEAARQKADEEHKAKVRAENCQRARKQKALMTSGQLLSTVNAQGERGFMDDAARNAEIRRADAAIASNCGH